MTHKYFPIKTKTACQLKWTWSTIFLSVGVTNSCHRVSPSTIDPGNFEQFHNIESKIVERKLMLEGRWPSNGCEYCQSIEESGGSSDRMLHLAIPNLVPPELDINPTAVNVTPRIVEVYFDNTCNMSCIYCSDAASSQIEQENIRFGYFQKNGLEIKNAWSKHQYADQLTKAFWTWMEKNSVNLRRLHVLGGEPFYQHQLETCLCFLESSVNPELELNIITNLKISQEKLATFLQRIKQLVKQKRIKRFDLTASIDCWGEEQEYIRYGLDLCSWAKNFDYVAKQEWITLNINQTINALSIKSMVPLIEYINQHKAHREIGQHFITCTRPSYMYPGIFGKGFFDKDFDKILKTMGGDTWQEKEAKAYMEGIQKEISAHDRNETELLKLKTFLTEIDRRRNLNWQKTFPWLVLELKNISI